MYSLYRKNKTEEFDGKAYNVFVSNFTEIFNCFQLLFLNEKIVISSWNVVSCRRPRNGAVEVS